ncbi:MAG: CehA/McbA family metallohydrolase [Sedimentisphaerales bacterium]|nr:CehA/McbA family metallohydrolase [Sedimentisphaerales bacterium]
MDRRTFIKTTGVVAAHAAVFSSTVGAKQSPQQRSPQAVYHLNPFEQQGQWYKAAFHVHTTTSDGDVDVPTRLAQYRDLGYAIVAVTDHWKTNDLSGFSDEKFLAINGMEAHPQTRTGAPAHHLVCLNLPHPFELDRKLQAQELVDNVIQVGGKVIYAHPYWTAHTIEEMSEIKGYIGVEVFNAVCQIRWGKGFGNVHWDQTLNKGWALPAVATDDVHSSKEIDVGWTMIKARGLGKAEVMEAIAAGSYYASCGPTVEDFHIKDGVVGIQSSPAVQIRFQFDRAGGGRVFNAKEGQTITSAQWKLPTNSPPGWIRAEVIDRQGRYAWTNPLPVPQETVKKIIESK